MMTFAIEDEEQKVLDRFLKHKCDLSKYAGAIGGRLTYCFTPTSLGNIVIVKCGCGKEKTLTDFSEW